MGDDVSKKDLQILESRLSRQIADVDKKVSELRRDSNKDLDEQNKIVVTVRKDLEKRMDDFDGRIAALQDGINTLARAHGELAKKVDKLS